MDLTSFIENVRHDLLAVAEAAGPDGRAAAERMLTALEPALRLSAFELLTGAADQVSAALPDGAVDVRLRGRDPEMVLVRSRGPAEDDVPTRDAAEVEDDVDEDPVARVTLRIPESLKARAEEAAARSGSSLNAWMVSALRSATTRRAVSVDVDLSSIPLDAVRHPGSPPTHRLAGRR